MTTRTYECMCLLDNQEVRKGWEPLKDAVAGLFTKHDAKVLSNRRWDERRLAYPIKGRNRATYLLVYFSADTQNIPPLRRELEFSEAMLRYMITECEELPADAHEPEAEFDVDAIPQDDAPEVVEEPEAKGDDDGKGDGKGDGEKAEKASDDAKAENTEEGSNDGAKADDAKASEGSDEENKQ